MKVVVTGAEGFLGWHTRLRLSAVTDHEVVSVGRNDWSNLRTLIDGSDAIIHLAGVNRASRPDEVEQGNIRLGEDLASAIRLAGKPLRVAMAGTIHAGRDDAYGRGKMTATTIVAEATRAGGGHFVDVCLPNIFGEHGLPNYNSFIATFIEATISGEEPPVSESDVELLHAQDAAQALISALNIEESRLRPEGVQTGVSAVLKLIREFHSCYFPSGEIPELTSRFRVNLFNTYRAALFPQNCPIELVPRSDARGTFVETVRSRGGEGQTSFSTTVPGVTRGDHFHLSKIERFSVIQGRGLIRLRRMFHDEVWEFEVSGDHPVAIDMPVGWTHNITNTGTDMLLTQFWSHELFRADAPDTFYHPVSRSPEGAAL